MAVEVITAAERRRQAAIELAKPLEVEVTEGVLKILGVGEARPRMEGTTYLLPVGELRGLKYEIGGVAGAVYLRDALATLLGAVEKGPVPLAPDYLHSVSKLS